jgi:hypothetical protein
VTAVRTLTVFLTAWLLVLLMPPGPASAGGPTSALLSVPGTGRTASLYYTDAAYEQLSDLVGVEGATPEDASGTDHASGPGVTVTWLIHDVEPWRVDRIYLGGNGGPWIATQEVLGETGSIWEAPVVWHQPTEGKALILLLDELGLAAAAGADSGGVGANDHQLSAAEPGSGVLTTAEPASPAASIDDGSGAAGIDARWWGLGGLAVGLLLAAGWQRARSLRQREPADDWDPDGDPAKEWLTVGR